MGGEMTDKLIYARRMQMHPLSLYMKANKKANDKRRAKKMEPVSVEYSLLRLSFIVNGNQTGTNWRQGYTFRQEQNTGNLRVTAGLTAQVTRKMTTKEYPNLYWAEAI